MLVQCWPTVYTAEPALSQHWVDVYCSLGTAIPPHLETLTTLTYILSLFSTLPLNPFNPDFTLSSSSTTSRELLSQFLTCSGWRWFEVGEQLKKITMYWWTTLKYILYKSWRLKGFCQFDIMINVLSYMFSFLLNCYESTVNLNISILSAQGSTLVVRIWRVWTSDSDVYRRSPHWKGWSLNCWNNHFWI